MPSIKNIDNFVETLNSLGDEPRIMEERGLSIEPVSVPEKSSTVDNPFLVNIEENQEDDSDMPNLADDLDGFDDDLFIDDDNLDIDDAPELEEHEDFSFEDDNIPDLMDGLDLDSDLTEVDDLEVDDLEVDDLEVDDLEVDDLEVDDLEVDDLEVDDLEVDDLEVDDLEVDDLEVDDLEVDDLEVDDLDVDDLDVDDLEVDDLEVDDLEVDDLEVDDLEVDDLDSPSEIDFDDIETPDDILDLEEIGGITDEDLDTSPDTLVGEDGSIKEIGIDEIGLDDLDEVDDFDEADSFESGFENLSIEDEVLEDDFGSLDDDDVDEFSLGDFGDSFNFDKEAASTSLTLEAFTESAVKETVIPDEVKYTDEEFASIKKTMNSLPLNLKIVIEEEIAENGLFGVRLEGLVDLLIDNASVKEIVKYVNKKLGHSIKISSSFTKLTALDFEKQKTKFSYILINSVLPKLKWLFPVTILLAVLYLIGYFWGYKIFKSEETYKKGYELILIDKYEEAYEHFLEGFKIHRKRKWYRIYADTYYARKAYDYAQDIYLKILNEDSKDLHAILSYSTIKGFDEGEYAQATYFLLDYIEHGQRNYQTMTTLGDLYMSWAKIDPSHYEDARLWYAETMLTYGPKPNILFKYLNYFISTDNLQEVKNYRRMFEISKDVKVDGDIYAKMSGYLMDKGIVDNVRETLFRGVADNPRNPNLHYQLARYFDSIGNDREVEKAARNAIFYYEYGGYLTSSELASLVDAKRLLGQLYSKEERYLASEKNYKEAATLYENLRERNFVEKDKKYGEIYSGYGDIFYYEGNSFNTAYNLFNKAEENNYKTPELSYKKGYIDYQFNNLEKAIMEFHESENLRDNKEAIIFAKANTLSLRGSYSAALTYYNMHLRILEKSEEDEETLYPTENEFHLAIIENYIRVYNNMGVTLYKLYGEKALPEVGMAFTKSTEYYDYLTRDPDFLVRSGLKDLAYYNTKAILYPDKEIELLLYNSIAKDFKDPNLGIVSKLD